MKYAYDYYEVEVPAEIDGEMRADVAIDEARERARLWTVPCRWTAVSDDGSTVKVCRKRLRRPKAE